MEVVDQWTVAGADDTQHVEFRITSGTEGELPLQRTRYRAEHRIVTPDSHSDWRGAAQHFDTEDDARAWIDAEAATFPRHMI